MFLHWTHYPDSEQKKTLIVIRNAVWLVEKQHIPIISVFGLTPPVLTTHGLPHSHRPCLLLQHMVYRTHIDHIYYYNTDAVDM